jgi:uncharacterized Zn finger protein (UPF0148 family)
MEQQSKKEAKHCVICGQPAVRVVDGEPSCEAHAGLVYENQVEDYTKKHMENDRVLETALDQSAKRD